MDRSTAAALLSQESQSDVTSCSQGRTCTCSRKRKHSKKCLSRVQKRCNRCKQFSTLDHICGTASLSTISVPDSLQAAGFLYTVANDNIVANSISQTTLSYVSRILGISLTTPPFLPPCLDFVVKNYQPDRVCSIRGDGNCLFASLAVAIGGLQQHAVTLRRLIVNQMLLINYPVQTLEVSLPRTDGAPGNTTVIAGSVEEYLKLSNMKADGVFGTDVELHAFCQLTGLNVFVHHTVWNYWHFYGGSSHRTNDCSIFIRQTTNFNHFETVLTLRRILPESFRELPRGSQQPDVQSCSHSLTNEILAQNEQMLQNSSTKVGDTTKETFVVQSLPEEEIDEFPNRNWNSCPHGDLFFGFSGGIENAATNLTKVDIKPSENVLHVPNFFRDERVETSTDGNTVHFGVVSPNKTVSLNKDSFVHSLPSDDFSDEKYHTQSQLSAASESIGLPSPFEIDTASESTVFSDDQVCSKCRRQPTSHHGFSIATYEASSLHRRVFGAPLMSSPVSLCNLCYDYCTASKMSWRVAWPSVLYSMLTRKNMTESQGRRLCSLIPLDIRRHWFGVIGELNTAVRNVLQTEVIDGTLMVDTTSRLSRFKKLVDCNTSASIEKALDFEPYPNIRCVYGCWCFIEDNGQILFHHLLTSIFNDFTSFQASFANHLRGISPNYFKPTVALKKFVVAASCRVDDRLGLVLHTCAAHSGGSPLQALHPPLHPRVKRSGCVHGERLAAVVPTIGSVSNAKANYASHTYQLLKSVGSFSGVSTVRLTNKRKWDVTCDALYHSEGNSAFFRDDIKIMMKKWVSDGYLIHDVANSILNYKPDIVTTTRQTRKCNSAVKKSSYVDLASCLRMNKTLATVVDDKLSPADRLSMLCLAQIDDLHGTIPPVFYNKCSKALWLLQIFSCLLPDFRYSLAERSGEYLVSLCLRFLDHFLLPQKSRQTLISSVLDELEMFYVQSVSEARPTLCTWSDLFFHAALFLNILCPCVQLFTLQKRLFHNVDFESLTADSFLVTFDSNASSRTRFTLPLSIHIGNREFELILLGSDCVNANCIILFRYGGSHSGFWFLNNKLMSPRKIEDLPETCVETFIGSSWSIALYCVVPQASNASMKMDFLMNFSCQGIFFCSSHLSPLTKDYPKSGYKCQCGLKSALRCPQDNCSAALCSNHIKSKRQSSEDKCFISPVRVQNCVTDSHVSNVSSVTLSPESVASNRDVSRYITTCSETSSFNIGVDDVIDVPLPNPSRLNTEAGNLAVKTDEDHSDETKYSLPLHILLNSELNLLHRRNPILINITARQKRLLENITACSPDTSIPLLQPEAMLFPSIFWSQREDGSYNGAIPSVLYNRANLNKQMGFFGIEDMLRMRVTNGSLLCSSNVEYIQFVFDTILNTQLDRCDVRIVLNRGWQELKKRTPASRVVDSSVFRMDNAESRKNVCEVASYVRDHQPTWFFTYTCNQKHHPGLRKVFEAFEQLYPKDTTPKHELIAAVQTELMVITRCWYRASQYVMNWIIESNERPLGKITHAWFRYEFQEETAALPHIHALLTTNNDVFSVEVREKVCCSRESFLGSLSNQHVSSFDERLDLADLFQSLQTHSCVKARKRCMKKTDLSDEPVCRVPKYPPGYDFSFKEVPMNLSCDTLELMQSLDLAEPDSFKCQLTPIEEIRGGKHHYPTNYKEHISPTNASIFALVRSSTNLQICDRNMSARYVAKYAAGVESRGYVEIRAGKTAETVTAATQPIVNEKIAGVKASLERINREAKKRSHVSGRLISVTESLWYIMNFPYVCTNLEFVHVSSQPKEYRAAVVLEKGQNRTTSFGVSFDEGCRVRNNELHLPAFRQFTGNQQLLLRDVQKSDLSADKVTLFGLRPPELLFVNELKLYFQWFFRKKSPKKKTISVHSQFLKRNISQSAWVDGLGYLVLLRLSAVEDFIAFCYRNGHSLRYDDLLTQIRDQIVPQLKQTSPSKTFVSDSDSHSRRNPIVVFTNVLPSNPAKFLIHFILTFGKFETEIDLFSVSNIRESFVVAQLFDDHLQAEPQVNVLVTAYYMDQLRFVPGSLKLTDKYLPLAHAVLREALVNNNLIFPFALPSFLDRDIASDSEVVLVAELAVDKQRLCDFLKTTVPSFPDETLMMSAKPTEPVLWVPKIEKQNEQSCDSIKEQVEVLDEMLESVMSYKSGLCSFIRHQIVVGPPGTGKSYLLFNCIAYALCQGLNCMITSLAAERSASVNGKHINALIPFPVEVASTCESLARNALARLQRDSVRSRYLQCLDVLFVEEISMISSEMWAAIDHVLQTVCSNYVPFAGKLVVATGDFFQLPPPTGSSLISSSFPLTTFHFLKLEHFVRMRNKAGQVLLRLIGNVPRSDEAIAEAWKILTEHCTFVDSWDDVALTDIRIFSTRKAEKEAVARKVEEVKNSGVAFQYVDCIDEMCTSSTNNWVAANDLVKRFLSRNCLEPDTLFVYQGAVMRLTVNMPDLQVFQGQLCVVVDISSLNTNSFVTVALAPPGCRQIPDVNHVVSNWANVKIRRATSPVSKYNFRTTCRRTQLPLKLFVASTIHKTMGETLPKVATQIVGSPFYALWMSEQLYVIASRVRELADITFVGDKNELEETLKTLLRKFSHWAAMTNAIMQSLSAPNCVIAQFQSHPFPPVTVQPPEAPVGYCYLLQSAPQPRHLYVGSTENLKRRLREHNSGGGSVFTNVVSRRPWVLLAYVSGFPTTEVSQNIRDFEQQWIQRMKMVRRIERCNNSAQQALEVARALLDEWRQIHKCLTLIVCSNNWGSCDYIVSSKYAPLPDYLIVCWFYRILFVGTMNWHSLSKYLTLLIHILRLQPIFIWPNTHGRYQARLLNDVLVRQLGKVFLSYSLVSCSC